MTERGQRWRLGMVAALMLACLTGLGARLAQLHAGPNEEKRARLTRTRSLVKDVAVSRGRILDRTGTILAMDVTRQELCADPVLVASNGNRDEVAGFLAGTLDMELGILRERLAVSNKRFVYPAGYGRPLDAEKAQRIGERKLSGIFFNDVMARSYPRGSSLCHVLGYVNLEGRGSSGIEQRFDDYLRGIPGLVVSELDGQRREMYDRRSLTIPAHDGADVHLTLDQYVQYMVDRALDSAMEIHRPAAAWAVVQKIKTGEILAMAARPAFDPNAFRGVDKEQLRNRCIAYNYEPGSTFKVGIVAAALNEGVVTPATVFDCENGLWMYAGRPLRDYHPYGRLCVADVLKKSSNIGAAKIALLLGPARLHAYLRSFGVGSRTGLELPGEEAGILNPLSAWTSMSPTRIAMGHEVAVTSLQMLQVLCTIANDGVAMKPHIVSRVVDAEGHMLVEQKPTALRRVVTPSTAATMRQMLSRVTETGGTAVRARVEGYSVAGKTGTAQKPIPGGYSDTLNMASFVGFIPAEDPEVGIIVVLDSPRDFHTGGAVAAPVFKEIAEQAVRYLDIPPDQDTQLALARPEAPAGPPRSALVQAGSAVLQRGGAAREAR